MATSNNENVSVMGSKQFSTKDIIQFFVYVIPIVFLFSNMSNKIDSLTTTVNEMKSDKKEDTQALKTFVQTIQVQQNTNTQDILLLKQQFQLQVLNNQKK